MSPFVSVAWPGGTLVEDSLDLRVASTDDVHYSQITLTYAEATKLYMPDSASDTVAFCRFPLSIPNGATITSAVWDLYNSQFGNDWTSPTDDRSVGCEQVDSAAAVTSRTNCLSRYTDVGTEITWASSTNTGSGSAVPNSPDLTSIVQTIVNRVGWASGNYLGLWLHHGGSASDTFQVHGYHATTSTLRPRFRVEFEYTS